MNNIIIFASIFIIGEIVVNFSVFKYLKKYFRFNEKKANSENETTKPFLGMDLSKFKGILERLTLFFCLVIGLSQVLIVFGALKIATRLDKTKEITNDYFLIGNFISILIGAIYYYLQIKLSHYLL
jgi:hypothetical protein